MAKRKKRRPIAEINVVPYIDVMLVLLVIFMITAPLLVQGVKIKLPSVQNDKVDSDPLQTLIIKVDLQGAYYVSEGLDEEIPVEEEQLLATVRTILDNNPEMSVLIAGDEEVRYVRIMNVLDTLKQAEINNVGLMTRPLEK